MKLYIQHTHTRDPNSSIIMNQSAINIDVYRCICVTFTRSFFLCICLTQIQLILVGLSVELIDFFSLHFFNGNLIRSWTWIFISSAMREWSYSRPYKHAWVCCYCCCSYALLLLTVYFLFLFVCFFFVHFGQWIWWRTTGMNQWKLTNQIIRQIMRNNVTIMKK